MTPTKNALRVQKHRTLKGNTTHKEKYKVLRDKYGIGSVLANKLKFWSPERIIDYLNDNEIYPLSNLKEADRL